METEGKVQLFKCGPQGIIVLIVPILPVEEVGADESRLEAQFLGAAAGFFFRFVDVEWRVMAAPKSRCGSSLQKS
jgi:hypothetical protein